jgi:hypothetical protein
MSRESYLFLGSCGLLSLCLGSLLPNTDQASITPSLSQSSVGGLLILGQVVSANFTNSLRTRNVLDGEARSDVAGETIKLAIRSKGILGSLDRLGG